MSNSEIALLYKAVIDEVISDSRQDFEANAVDEGTLQDLKAIWMEKLANTKIAEFGWVIENQENIENPQNFGNIPINPSNISNMNVSNPGYPPIPMNASANQSTDPISLSYPQIPQNMGGLQLPTANDDNSGLVLPNDNRLNQADGPQDFKFEIELPKDKAEKFIKQVKKNNEKQKKLVQVDGNLDSDEDDDDDAFNDIDGDDEDVANESDQLNSDLDDSEDDENKSGDENDSTNDNYIFCLYDKVQRVKNKWKCNLKDGIASINGKDYGFAKATGESDW